MTGFQCCIILKRVNEGHITILNVNYEKKNRYHYIVVLIKL